MPRTCLACSSPERRAIDKALVLGEPLRNIAKRVSISPAGLLRHKNHVSQSIVRASERREELLGGSVLAEMKRVQRKAWELVGQAESEGDHRGAIVALREVRECLESLGDMLAKAETANGGGDGPPMKVVVEFIGPGDKPLRELPSLANTAPFCPTTTSSWFGFCSKSVIKPKSA